MIAQHVLDSIRTQTNIVDIISEFVDLKQKGHEHVAPCPFLDHTDEAPSFSVNEVKQIYKCFGCGKGGNVFTFLMEYQRMTFTDAVKFCAGRVGIKLVFDDQGKDALDTLSDLHERAGLSFTAALKANDEYLLTRRRIDEHVVKAFRLGFDDGSFLKSVAADYPADVLFDSGLFEKSGGKMVDRWSGRYTIPLIDMQEKIVGFSGTNVGIVPKYTNSPKTKLYDKSTFLFGLNLARDLIIKSKGVIITEGYFDCISMHQAQFKNTVAVCGTALTSQHGKMLSRYCKDVVLLFDTDPAGLKAINKSVPALFEHGLNIYVARCPNKQDPDDVLRVDEGRSRMLRVLQDSVSWFDFRFQYSTPEQKSALVTDVMAIADEIESSDRRSLFLDLCSERLQVHRDGLVVRERFTYSHHAKLPDLVLAATTELILLAAVHAHPEIVETIDREIFNADNRLLLLYDRIVTAAGDNASLYNNLTKDESTVMNSIILMSEKSIDVQSARKTVIKTWLNRKIKVVMNNMKSRESSAEDCSDLVANLKSLLQERKEFTDDH